MSGLDEAAERIKKEGYSSEEIKNALQIMIDETRNGDVISDLDKYLDNLVDK